jgi:uncharacterized protein YfaS (alpha-2-macroglobulin family)
MVPPEGPCAEEDGMQNPNRFRQRILMFTASVPIAMLALALSLHQTGPQPAVRPQTKAATGAERWKEVDQLVSEQKYEAALKEVEAIRAAAQTAGNQDELTRALIKEVQLRVGLHGYETAVRFLKEQEWPSGELNRAALNLFYARTLVTYYQAYSWEINRREKVESRGTVDLRAWTRDQISLEAQRAYDGVWKQRVALGSEPIARFAEYMSPNDYPPGIRGTLRDAVSYLYVEFLADSSLWTPQESGELYRLDLQALAAGGEPADAAGARLLDPSVHPLMKLGYILDDLENWHSQNKRPEAALEARLERLRRLHASFTDNRDRDLILADLEKRLPAYRSYGWWAVGKATLAEFVRESGEPGKLVRARSIAEQGLKAYPDSIGGKRCLFIVKSIEAPGYTVESMLTDGVQRRSIELTHRNVRTVYFRAYPIDLVTRIRTARDYNLLPNQDEQQTIMKTRSPAFEWSASLPPTPDFESHRTFITPPFQDPGCFLIAVSVRPDFSQSQPNRIATTFMIVSDIVILSTQETGSSVSVRVLTGETGRPVPGTTVSLYKYDWQAGHSRIEDRVTDVDGKVQFSYAPDRERFSCFLVARKGTSIALDSDQFRLGRRIEANEVRASLIYTDRSVYRPLQKIYWKILAYGGTPREGRFRTLPSQPVTVSLLDPNGQSVESKTLSTNSFGSASGEFIIPAGRILGSWRITGAPYGEAHVRVEEYKRPTFDVSLKDPASPLRLNRPATFTGEARYYFGLPVTSGSVKWRVTMEPEYPWWWEWGGWYRGGRGQARTVAAGESTLGEDGSFKITFTPEAGERLGGGDKDVTYRYRVSADLTDEGGETRSASKTFRLGLVSVEAGIDINSGFLLERVPSEATITRTDLNGTPRPGNGNWRLVTLKQPDKTLLPADQPIPVPPSGGKPEPLRTAGDLLRPRWSRDYSYANTLRTWPEGREIAHGELRQETGSGSTVRLPGLAAGIYRLHYETTDDFGAACTVAKEFVVAGDTNLIQLPALLLADKSSATVGQEVRFLAHSGIAEQMSYFEIWRSGRLSERRKLTAGTSDELIRIPIGDEDRGGFTVRLTVLSDYQLMQFDIPVFVPWDNKELKVEFSSFRDKFRPGATETWRVFVKSPSGANVEAGAAELLAYMYDRSLDIFAPHNPPNVLSLYPHRATAAYLNTNLGQSPEMGIVDRLVSLPPYPYLEGDRLRFYEGYGIGGPGVRDMRFKGVRAGGMVGGVLNAPAPATVLARAEGLPQPQEAADFALSNEQKTAAKVEESAGAQPQVELRSNFAETAFWRPHLLTGPDGSAAIEFTVPDSVTAWSVWVHAVTRDLQGGILQKEARSYKDLMVRPYLPRFLREGDKADIKVVVNNASDRDLAGRVTLDILDPVTNESVARKFGLGDPGPGLPFTVIPGGGGTVMFAVQAPAGVGSVAFKVVAVSGDTSDGELRPMPILPGRMQLSQSRFVTLKNNDRRVMTFDDLKKPGDPTLVNEQLVVTVDAQLFYSVLSALPYLVNYPYECTEQTLNRFVSAGILSSLYRDYPAVARMAQEFAKRDTRLETWDAADPNRKMALEETPWLVQARGGKGQDSDLINVLDPRIAKAEKESAIVKLRKAQTSIGAFPWWPGGPPSPYMTLYIMYGFAKAAEFRVDVPRDMVERGWSYLAQHFREGYAGRMLKDNCCWEFLTFLNYVASCYPDPAWTGSALTPEERRTILNHCFKHWKEHSPYLKGMLALTLERMNRAQDAQLVFASVMDSARTTEDQGTFWAPEERSWLWYNDTIETQAFALRTLTELSPQDSRRHGLVQWLFLNKKLNHWKSTRATAEVIYSLVHYLESEKALGVSETATVRVGGQTVQYVFEPDKYTGGKNQTVVPGDRVNPDCATVTVEKEGKGIAFASATWNFSTEKLPEEARGDFFSVTRKYFKRENTGREFILKPLAEGEVLKPGDEVEIQLSIRSGHAAEYVHLRDPRAAGLEPENAVSRYKWDMGIAWYEETRDSGTNFFFDWLPAGEYTFKYRLRANMAGEFRVGPATLQSMYAPEFNAYSSGAVLRVK